jgi:hypothetical protein
VAAAFLVERYLPGVSQDEVLAGIDRVQRSLELASPITVRYLGCTFLPEEEAVICRFDAPSAEEVARVNRRANFAYDRIVIAEELLP